MPLREHTKFLKDLTSCGFKPSEPFLSMMLHHIRESKLVELRTKMCILIPKSRSMMGCIDETNLLEYSEVFLQCSYESKHKISVSSHNLFPYQILLLCKIPSLQENHVI
ncbi:unnamed protein product [Brassica rapa]|uniref:RNA-dependent RNA polymerase n=1 Tax=Brassica campestris TaxID=3711 RepID=A0A8D9LXK2_BRACM|nr:unnamed protein product [Brassica rapa]